MIYIFLSGGLAQHESFDMKPGAPEDAGRISGAFTPGGNAYTVHNLVSDGAATAARPSHSSSVSSST